ncbi:MAG TPA: hypothetical protein VJ835_10375 [Fimbriimonadaceae bacterium]|nr:hypothetical protein [Fimbriimonadaceae bacterium]
MASWGKWKYVAVALTVVVATGAAIWAHRRPKRAFELIEEHAHSHRLLAAELANLPTFDGPLCNPESGVAGIFKLQLLLVKTNWSYDSKQIPLEWEREVQPPDLKEGVITPSITNLNKDILDLTLGPKKIAKSPLLNVQAAVLATVEPGHNAALWTYPLGKVRFCLYEGKWRVHDIQFLVTGVAHTEGIGPIPNPPDLSKGTRIPWFLPPAGK